MLKVADIRALAPEEMREKVESLKRDLLNLRVDLRMGKLERHATIREVKKTIARLLTIIRETDSEGGKQPVKKAIEPKKEIKKEVKVKKEAEKKVTKKQTAKPAATQKAEKVKK